MNSSIIIPKTINVGYQKRPDTYTGKLAYIVYYDENGKLRKEASWNNWRDQSIPNDEFANVPTSGFVLNKKVGDYKSGWNHRQAYCRIYDPRNFEFEITVENLLYILENTNSIKGKGLEGDFVYGWDGKNLVLMPVDAPDYKEIDEYNKILQNKETIKTKDLIVGATYIGRDNRHYVYMGRHEYYGVGYSWRVGEEICKSRDYDDIPRERTLFGYCTMSDYIHIDFPYGKHHWFAYKNSESGFYKWKFTQFKSLPKNKLIICVDSEFSQEYSEIYEEMIRKKEFSPRDLDNQKYVRYTYEEFVKYANEESCRFGRKYRLNDRFFSDQHFEYQIVYDDETMLWTAILASRYTKKDIEDYHNRFKFEKKAHSSDSQIVPMSIEELYTRLKPCYRETYLENRFLYEREDFYGNEEE